MRQFSKADHAMAAMYKADLRFKVQLTNAEK